MLNRSLRSAHLRSAVRGFTLLELLVVLAIIAVLISIAVPAYNRVSRVGKRAKCAANLKSIGNAVQAFMTDNDGLLPDAAGRPSDERNQPSDRGLSSSAAPIYLLLADEFKSPALTNRQRDALRQQSGWPGEKYPTHEVFHCPADRIRSAEEQQRSPLETYFQREGTSYEWNTALSGRRLTSQLLSQLGGVSSTPLMWDFEPFHGGRNRLYADLRVGVNEDR